MLILEVDIDDGSYSRSLLLCVKILLEVEWNYYRVRPTSKLQLFGRRLLPSYLLFVICLYPQLYSIAISPIGTIMDLRRVAI